MVIPEMETQLGADLTRVVVDRGHNAPPDHKFKVYISGEKRRITEPIQREMRRRSAVKSVIGRAKDEHRMGRNYLAGPAGDAANAGYSFRRLLAWPAPFLSAFLAALITQTDQKNRPDFA